MRLRRVVAANDRTDAIAEVDLPARTISIGRSSLGTHHKAVSRLHASLEAYGQFHVCLTQHGQNGSAYQLPGDTWKTAAAQSCVTLPSGSLLAFDRQMQTTLVYQLESSLRAMGWRAAADADGDPAAVAEGRKRSTCEPITEEVEQSEAEVPPAEEQSEGSEAVQLVIDLAESDDDDLCAGTAAGSTPKPLGKHMLAVVIGSGTQLDGKQVVIVGGLEPGDEEGTSMQKVKLRVSGEKVDIKREYLMGRDDGGDGAARSAVSGLDMSATYIKRPLEATPPKKIMLNPDEPEGFMNPLVDNPAHTQPAPPNPRVLEMAAMLDALELRQERAGIAKLEGLRAASGLAQPERPGGASTSQQQPRHRSRMEQMEVEPLSKDEIVAKAAALHRCLCADLVVRVAAQAPLRLRATATSAYTMCPSLLPPPCSACVQTLGIKDRLKVSRNELEMIIAHADGQTDYSTGTPLYFCGQSVESYVRSGKTALLTSADFKEYRAQWRRDFKDGIVESFDDMLEWHFEKHLIVKPPWFDGDLVHKWKMMAAEHLAAGGDVVDAWGPKGWDPKYKPLLIDVRELLCGCVSPPHLKRLDLLPAPTAPPCP